MNAQFTLDSLLEKFRVSSSSNRETGSRFEDLIKKYLVTDPLYANLIESVWLWSEFPYRDQRPDTGIDIVAKTKETEEYWAIQCKFYLPNHTIIKADIDSFLSTSGKTFLINGIAKSFSRKIVVSTTNKWSTNAEQTLIDQIIPVTRITIDDLYNSSIDWNKFDPDKVDNITLLDKKKLRLYQLDALQSVLSGLEVSDRGKMVMACGTGKTLVSLKIMEKITEAKGVVVFFAPSIALVNQTITEWAGQIGYEARYIVICSDRTASNLNRYIDKTMENPVDSVYPASTDSFYIQQQYEKFRDSGHQIVFFSTYQSIDVLMDVQKRCDFIIDFIVCDEAHRTTGVTLSGEDESHFIKVHDNRNLKAKKRLYMTATPRIYGDSVKKKADENDAVLCSMDDAIIYGEELYRLSFSDAVSKDLLADYKVLVLAVDEDYVSSAYQHLLSNKDNELNLDDSVKIIGCWNGLSKKTVKGDELHFESDPTPMKKAVAFCNTIALSKKATELFQLVESDYRTTHGDDDMVRLHAKHVDGKHSAIEKKNFISWLKQDQEGNSSKILCNARCLSEGIDVPALDAVMFLAPRNSIVDIVQSVGRVMRKADGKKYGYIILPIGVPSGVKPEEALQNNEKYSVVWDVLQALRAHDDRFNNTINKIDLNKSKPDSINIIGVGFPEEGFEGVNSQQLTLNLDSLKEWKDSIYAKIVQKCGTRRYWETWAKDVAVIAQHQSERILAMVKQANNFAYQAFKDFVYSLRTNINQSISEEDAIDMLSQHTITKPVFDALFDDYKFVENNPVSRAMQKMLEILDNSVLSKESEILHGFYKSVKERAAGIDNALGKQKIIIELYDKFFKTALPKQVQKLGIVYTPVEVVDFIIHSTDFLLKKEFSTSLSNDGVNIIDPFTGTGTFIVRLMESGLIDKEKLTDKYSKEIYANEIVLLAYYIAVINIEETYHNLISSDEYKPFEGIVLTDTFQLSETKDKVIEEALFPQNSKRAREEISKPVKVIIGNPPYSIGQKSVNDDNKNVDYPILDNRIANTYQKESNAQLNKGLYDSYIKAFRWASDRLDKEGIIAFVTNGAYINNQGMDGFRKSLINEFSAIYCFNLRGDARTQGEQRRKEKGNIFGAGSRAPIAITILIKKEGKKKDGFIHYYDIGDYLSRDEKLQIISDFGNISKIRWEKIYPDKNNDWTNTRNSIFESFIPMGSKQNKTNQSIFGLNYAIGMFSGRNAWVYNFSKTECCLNIELMIKNYNSQVEKSLNNRASFSVDNNPRNIAWSERLKTKFQSGKKISFDSESVYLSSFRPFTKQWLYFQDEVIERPSVWQNIFPKIDSENRIIALTGVGTKVEFSALMTTNIQDLHLETNGQCFPLYWYEKNPDSIQMSIFEEEKEYQKKYAITDWALDIFKSTYGTRITKENIFYYIYGIFHSKAYKKEFENDLSKTLARIPMVNDFATFAEKGKQLADLHIDYEGLDKPACVSIDITKEDYRVSSIKFAKNNGKEDMTTILYNDYITIAGIPLKAYEYVVNGKPAINWIMERYELTVDSRSGIVNNPNLYSEDPKYVLNLLLSIINLSLKTMEIVESLPNLNLIE